MSLPLHLVFPGRGPVYEASLELVACIEIIKFVSCQNSLV
jgi:hypothetical protein